MKNVVFITLFFVMFHNASFAQNSTDLKGITEAVHAFADAGDHQDALWLDKVLHPQFRAVVNRAFGSTDLSLIDKATYLQLVGDKKIGGDKREVNLLQIDVVNNIASVKAIFQGHELRFTTYVSLVKLSDGTWQVVSDMPDISKA